MDELDSIISQLESGVKGYKNEILEDGLKHTNWDAMNTLDQRPRQVGPAKDDPIAQINQAYNRIERRAQLNNLTDSFHMPTDTETKSATTRSLETTISRYSRQYNILQDFK